MQQLHIPIGFATLCLCGTVKIMTRKKLLFNSSVLKPLFNSTEKKLLMSEDLDVSGDPCGCGPTPKYVDITISGITICPCENFLAGKSWLFTGNPNNTYRIQYTGKAGDICKWEANGPIINCKVFHESAICEDPIFREDNDTLVVYLELDTSTDIVTIEIRGDKSCKTVLGEKQWIFNGSASVESGCVNVTINNNYAEEDCWTWEDNQPQEWILGWGGTVEVKEV